MNRLEFVVLGHRNPRQLARLVEALGHDRTHVHVDSRIDPRRYAEFEMHASGAVFVPRHASAWASWGIVEAILEGMRSALSNPDVTHVGVLSGQDIPLVPVDYMELLLPERMSFARASSMPFRFFGKQGGMDRLQQLNRPFRGHRLRLPVRRDLPPGVTPYVAAPWSIFARHHIESMLSQAELHRRWWRWVWIPDELFFATVLGTHHLEELTGLSPGYTEWPGGPHPRTFSDEDIPALVRLRDCVVDVPPARSWFARKFDDESGVLAERLRSELEKVPLSGAPLETVRI